MALIDEDVYKRQGKWYGGYAVDNQAMFYPDGTATAGLKAVSYTHLDVYKRQELNTKSDYCQVCGYDGEIKIVEEEGSGKLIWRCV